MLLLVEWIIGVCIVISVFVGLYLVVRSFHRKWRWQDQVNENNLRRAILEEIDVQWEVAPDGFVRAARRKGR